jgi:hypothetical protein
LDIFVGKALTAIWCFVNDYGSTKIFGRIFNQNRVWPAGLPQKKRTERGIYSRAVRMRLDHGTFCDFKNRFGDLCF